MSSSPMTWNLFDPGMGLLERAGLAALYMSLRAAEQMGVDLTPLRWEPGDLTPESVTLRWDGPDNAAITRLMRWAWQVRDGVLYLPAVHRDPKQQDFAFQRVATHNGILETFLQHDRVQPKGRSMSLVENIEDDKQYVYYYQTLDPSELAGKKADSVARRAKKKQAESPNATDGRRGKSREASQAPSDYLRPITILSDRKTGFFMRSGELSSLPIELKSWAKPGIAGRFGSEPAWVGPPAMALLLMVAPISCLYMRLPRQRKRAKKEGSAASRGAKGKKEKWSPNWVYVVPAIEDLEEFDQVRPSLHLDPKFIDVASISDAALRFVAEYCAPSVRSELRTGCRATAMGQVSFYNPNQMVRKAIVDVEKGRPPRRYLHLHHAFGHQIDTIAASSVLNADQDDEQQDSGEAHSTVRIRLPSVRGRIADNLISSQPGQRWYTDLAIPTAWERDILESERKRIAGRSGASGKAPSIERLCFRNLIRLKGGLMELIREPEMWDSPHEAMFVEAFWESLRSLYRQEARAAKKRGGSRSAKKRIRHLREEIYRSLMRSKTRELTRQALAELIAKAGQGRAPDETVVRDNPATIWKLIDDPLGWKRARDLALLALATYTKKASKPDQKGSKPSPLTNTTGDDK
jgi:CRISPR-associated protein Cas8a1/Csx13